MIAYFRTHRQARVGSEIGEYEDAAAGPITDRGVARCAIADGATETAFAGEWARCLADNAARLRLPEAIGRSRSAFDESLRLRAHPAPWYVEAKLTEGAFATVLALELEAGGKWSAEAVGDCSLLHLRDGHLLRAWPIEDAAEFGHRPVLVSSKPEMPVPDIEFVQGEWRAGDVMLLASDALAAYLIDGDPAEALSLDENGFATFLERARGRGMRNDDVTLVEIGLR